MKRLGVAIAKDGGFVAAHLAASYLKEITACCRNSFYDPGVAAEFGLGIVFCAR